MLDLLGLVALCWFGCLGWLSWLVVDFIHWLICL